MLKLDLPKDSMNLWVDGDQHAFAWRFYNTFGFFPDRDGSCLSTNGKGWWLETDQDISFEKHQEIYLYCEDPDVFQMPTGETLQIDLDWKDMMVKLNKYAANDETLDIQYIGHGPKQYIHFSRSLTAEEKTALKNLISNYINFL